jgi:hypothetical protein
MYGRHISLFMMDKNLSAGQLPSTSWLPCAPGKIDTTLICQENKVIGIELAAIVVIEMIRSSLMCCPFLLGTDQLA